VIMNFSSNLPRASHSPHLLENVAITVNTPLRQKIEPGSSSAAGTTT
jgi:hypothetical protein